MSVDRVDMTGIRIGVAAVQGAVSEHLAAFQRAIEAEGLQGEPVPVRTREVFNGVDAMVLPGGESTAISKLLVQNGIHDELVKRARDEGMPVMGTCAGTILLASRGDEQVRRTETRLLGLMDIEVERNAFGRQRESFEAPLRIDLPGTRWDDEFPGVFIRAPAVLRTWGDCRVLSRYNGRIVAVKQGRLTGLAFHPELANDLRFHRDFVRSVADG